MKKILLFILSITLVFSLSASLFSCGEDDTERTPGPCAQHKDEDENGICDVCKQPTIEIPEEPEEVTVAFTLKDQDGAAVPGVTLSFTEKGKTGATPVSATADSLGKLTAKLVPATYTVTSDYSVEEIGYYFLDTTEIKVEKTTTALDVLFVNNNPNGTEDRPYPLSVGENEVNIPAGETHYYVVYRAVNLIASIEGAQIKVTYSGAEYLPDAENKIDFAFLGTDTNSVEIVKIENVGASETSLNVSINSAPGTYGNPYEVSGLDVELSADGITSKDIVYFSYTSTFSGRLTLTVTGETESTHAAMVCNSRQVTTLSENSNVISLEVTEGDEVIIDLATTLEEGATVSFILSATTAE